MTDRPRLLHQRSELGYTDRMQAALAQEPEAVDADYQRELTAAAPRRAQARDQEAWSASRERIRQELAVLGGHRFPRDVSSQLRVIGRQLDRVDRLLH